MRSVLGRSPWSVLTASLLILGLCGVGYALGAHEGIRDGSATGGQGASERATRSAYPGTGTGQGADQGAGPGTERVPVRRNPFHGRRLHLEPGPAHQAAKAARGHRRALLRRLAAVPTAVWLTPEPNPAGAVGERVARIARAAERERATAVLVVYGIPARDCTGGHSAGGLDRAGYRAWVRQIARQLSPRTAVVLEPDALASAPQCGLVSQRQRLLSWAVRKLTRPGAAVYLDAGHAAWVPAPEMATMLRNAGVARARGFAVNVAGYDATGREVRYAKQVARAGGGRHFVVDTGRNGAGGNGEWCNPSGQALGPEPRGVRHKGRLDAYLWIKPPGESDGTCNGGPPAGAWWTKRALDLARKAGW